MLTRLNGLILITNTMLPFLILLAVCGLFFYVKGAIEERWIREVRPQLQVIENAGRSSAELIDKAVANASGKFRSAAKGLNAVATKLETIATAAAKPLETLGNITVPTFAVALRHDKILCPGPGKKNAFGKPVKPCFPRINKGSFNIGEKLAKPFDVAYDAMAAAAQPLVDLQGAFAELNVLNKIPDEAKKAQESIANLAAIAIRLAEPVGSFLAAIGYAAMGLFAWFGIQYVVRALAKIAAGWRMLTTGQPHG